MTILVQCCAVMLPPKAEAGLTLLTIAPFLCRQIRDVARNQVDTRHVELEQACVSYSQINVLRVNLFCVVDNDASLFLHLRSSKV